MFLKRLSQFQDMFLVVKVGVRGSIHPQSFMSFQLSTVLFLSDNHVGQSPDRLIDTVSDRLLFVVIGQHKDHLL